MRLASTLGCQVRVAVVPPEVGKDPDDVVQTNPEAWKTIVQNHVDKMTYLFERMVAHVDPTDVTGKKQAGAQFLPEISALSDRIEQAHWMKRFGETLDVPLATVQEMVKGAVPAKRQVPVRATKPEASPSPEPVQEAVPVDKTVELVLSLALQEPSATKLVMDTLPQEVFEGTPYAPLYVELVLVYTSGNLSPNHSLFETVRQQVAAKHPEMVTLVDRIALCGQHYLDGDNLSQRDTEEQLVRLIDQVKEQSKKRRRDAILAQMKRAEHAKDTARVQELMRAYQSLL